MQVSKGRPGAMIQRGRPTPADDRHPDERTVEPTIAVELAELFRLLGDPTRVRILFALLQAGELCVHDIAAAVDASETKVSQAMRLLRNAGVVRNRRDGRNIIYRLDDAHVRLLLEISRDHVAHVGADG